jgi:hypothetical protein
VAEIVKCSLCGENVDLDAPYAVTLIVKSRASRVRQELYAHSRCVARAVESKTQFDPDLFAGLYDD